MRAPDLALAIAALYPGEDTARRVAVVEEPDGSGTVAVWTLDAPQPTEAELLAALPAAQARAAAQAEMNEVGAELSERYTLHARALALGKPQVAREIEEEAASLLAYFQEVRDAATSPS